LARVRPLIADKTGTLTTGIARLIAIEPAPGHEAEAVLRAAASLDQLSHHVIAASIVRAAAARGLALAMPSEVVEAPGAGISGQVDGHAVRLGTLDYAAEGAAPSAWAERVLRRARVDEAAAVFVAIDGGLAGALLLADEIRTEAPRALRRLRAVGIARIVLLSGDRAEVAEAVASALGVDALLAERSPADKLDAVRAENALAVTAMVGDGINDAPALAAADVGVALGVRGAAAASEAADVVLLVDELDRLAEGVAIARGARGIALQSILVGMGLSGCAMIVAAFGHLPPVAGALLQEAIDVAVILNALRALRTGGGTRRGRLPADEIARLEADHRLLRPLLDRVRATADRLQDGALAVPPAELRALARSLDKQILAHERADETRLHPRVASLLGGDDPMAAISRTHREIAHLVRRFAQLAAALPAQQPPAAEELRELRSILYALDAILRLHFAQEEEIYASVAADAGRPRAATG
jgi:soluble P-type ATPase